MDHPARENTPPGETEEQSLVESGVAKLAPSARKRVFSKFLLAALGSIPWVGGFLSAIASLKTEEGDVKADDLRTQWLAEHQRKLALLNNTLNEISERFEKFGEQVAARLESEDYLALAIVPKTETEGIAGSP